MPSPRLISARSMLILFGYDVDTMSPKAIRSAAARLRTTHYIRVKSIQGTQGLRHYASDVEAAIARQPDHQFQPLQKVAA